jgi:hypothetical protein
MLSKSKVGFRASTRAIGTLVAVLALLAGSLGAIAETVTRATPAGAVGAPTRVVTYEVRGLDNGSDLESFAAQAAQTYADPRGWSLGGSVAFVRVPSGGSFTLWLAAPGRVPGFGSPCSSLYSCRQGRNVIINEARWLGASPSWNAAGASLRDYRHMVVNHETGHWIGFGHALCSGGGAPAPVMQQQSISLQGCAPNSWPLDSERHAAAARLGVEIRYGVPFGSLEQVQPWLHAVRVIGWAIDPDTAAPDIVQITVDGASTFRGAQLTRRDVAAAYPGYGPAHGFDVTVPAANGQHAVCAYALNISGGGNTALLGCRTVVVGSPFGTVEHVDSGPRIARVSGWVIDPDTPASTTVHIYVDGVATAVPANRSRADVGRAFAGFGADHGFDQLVAAPSGRHQVCVYGINAAGPGANTTLQCRTITVGGAPFGAVDSMRAGPNQIRVSGWVIDRDLATPGRVHVYVDGAATPVQADRPRPSVGRAYPLYGENHGFDRVVPATPGRHQVCVYGIDLSGPGDNTTIGCRTVVVGGAPFGAVDSVHAASGQVRVTGWEIDPDSAGPGRVHVYVDGRAAGAGAAGNPRGDIAAAYPLYGAGHGYDVTVPATPGGHGVCVYGVNSAGPGGNTTLGCRVVGVPG